MKAALRFLAYGIYAMVAGAILLRWSMDFLAVGEPECHFTEQGCPVRSIWELLYSFASHLSVPFMLVVLFKHYRRFLYQVLGHALSERPHP